MKYPHIQQHDEKDCGAACLAMIAEYYGLKLPIARLRELIKVDNMGANMYGLMTGASEIGLEAECLEGNWEELNDSLSKAEFGLPVIARIINEHGYEHFIVVWAISEKGVVVGDPGGASTGVVPVSVYPGSALYQFLPDPAKPALAFGKSVQSAHASCSAGRVCMVA